MQAWKNTVLAFFFLAIAVGAYANMKHIVSLMTVTNLAIAILATVGAVLYFLTFFRGR